MVPHVFGQSCFRLVVVVFEAFFLWLLYLYLNSVSVLPMYSAFPSSCCTEAWYITLLVQHSPGTGHVGLFWQLHLFVAVGSSVASTFLL